MVTIEISKYVILGLGLLLTILIFFRTKNTHPVTYAKIKANKASFSFNFLLSWLCSSFLVFYIYKGIVESPEKFNISYTYTDYFFYWTGYILFLTLTAAFTTAIENSYSVEKSSAINSIRFFRIFSVFVYIFVNTINVVPFYITLSIGIVVIYNSMKSQNNSMGYYLNKLLEEYKREKELNLKLVETFKNLWRSALPNIYKNILSIIEDMKNDIKEGEDLEKLTTIHKQITKDLKESYNRIIIKEIEKISGIRSILKSYGFNDKHIEEFVISLDVLLSIKEERGREQEKKRAS